jgi:DNA invertase Pin-like site-specific DNA recombinase
MRAAAYLRVSTDQQAEHGFGLGVQRKAIAAYAKANGHKITAWYSDEGVSGSNGLDGRPALVDAFRALESGQAEALLVYRLDRLSRKLRDQITWTEKLESRGCHVVSVTEPDVGEDEMRTLVRHILGAIGEYERATIVRRMQDGRRAKSEQGGYAYGSPAFGQRAEHKQLVTDEAEAAIAAEIAALRADGRSLREIAAQLNSAGRKPKRGGAWHPVTVSRVLDRQAS